MSNTEQLSFPGHSEQPILLRGSLSGSKKEWEHNEFWCQWPGGDFPKLTHIKSRFSFLNNYWIYVLRNCIDISVFYSRQIVRHERRSGGIGPDGRKPHVVQTAETMGRQRKAGTSRLTGSHTFGGNKCPGGRQRKVGKGVNLQHLNVTGGSSCPHCNNTVIKLAMQIRSICLAWMPWQ